MCRLLGYVSTSPVTLQTAVGAGLEDFVNLSDKHGDGWGLAHVERNSGEWSLYRVPEQASKSSTLRELFNSNPSDAAAFHLRWATPGLTIRTENTHPFVRRKYAFMHNGAISAAIDALLPPSRQSLLEGDTDSEKYFLVVLEHIEHAGAVAGITEAVQKICDSCDFSSLNAMLLTPDELIVVSQYRPERIPQSELDDYYELRFKMSKDRVVVASSGWHQDGWTRLPNHSVSCIDRRSLTISTHLIQSP